jgi:hypothetical protein
MNRVNGRHRAADACRDEQQEQEQQHNDGRSSFTEMISHS